MFSEHATWVMTIFFFNFKKRTRKLLTNSCYWDTDISGLNSCLVLVLKLYWSYDYIQMTKLTKIQQVWTIICNKDQNNQKKKNLAEANTECLGHWDKVKRSMKVQGHFKAKGRVLPHSASSNLHTVFAESTNKRTKMINYWLKIHALDLLSDKKCQI